MSYPIIDLGGRGPVVHWATANGLPLSSYRPITASLTDRYRVVSLPLKGLWPNAGPPPSTPGSWVDLGFDLVAGLTFHGLKDVVAVGHSFGGVAALAAAVRYPGVFRGLVLLDPTILTDAMLDQFRLGKTTGWQAVPHPLAGSTRARRRDFESPEEALDFWRGRRMFVDWPEDVLRAYVEGMVVPRGEGGYTLAWPPEWEAYYYESFHLDVWDDVARVGPGLPVLAVAGQESDTFRPETVRRFQARVPWATVATVPGGHLFPQSAPAATAAIVGDWLDRINR